MVQDEGHTKDEVASIGPYTNYLTLLFIIPMNFKIATITFKVLQSGPDWPGGTPGDSLRARGQN